jgi:predicted metal-dependent phosphoesterase TrpH
MDSHVKAHIGVIIHFFLIVVDGHPIEVQDQDKKLIVEARKKLLEEIDK